MKYTIDTTEKTIQLEVSNPIEMVELLINLETLKELYDGYTVSLVNPNLFDLIPNQPCVQPQPWDSWNSSPWNPSPWTTVGQQITYTNNTTEKNQ